MKTVLAPMPGVVVRGGSRVLDDAIAVQRLLEALRPFTLAFVPLVYRGPGRPPLDDDPQAVLAHPRRREIYDLIEARPGIPSMEIRHELGVGGGTVENHLDRLERAGLIETRSSGRFVRLYPAGAAPPSGDPQLLPETTRKVARAVLRGPGRISAEIAAEIQLSRVRVNHHLRVLEEAGLVRSHSQGYQVRHEPTDRLRAAAEHW